MKHLSTILSQLGSPQFCFSVALLANLKRKGLLSFEDISQILSDVKKIETAGVFVVDGIDAILGSSAYQIQGPHSLLLKELGAIDNYKNVNIEEELSKIKDSLDKIDEIFNTDGIITEYLLKQIQEMLVQSIYEAKKLKEEFPNMEELESLLSDKKES